MTRLDIIYPKLNRQEFHKALNEYLSSNINDSIIEILSNMLALDYFARVSGKIALTQYLQKCILNLKTVLKHRIIDNSDFSFALTLFAVAITEEKLSDNAEDDFLLQKPSKEQLIEAFINLHFNDLSPQTLSQIAVIFSKALEGKFIDAKMNYLNNKPELVRNIVAGLIEKPDQGVMQSIEFTLNELVNKNLALENYVTKFKQITSKLLSAVCAIGVVAASTMPIGIFLPVVLVPSAILSIKYAPKLGEIIADKLINIKHNVKAKRLAQKTLEEPLNLLYNKTDSMSLELKLQQLGQKLEQQTIKNLANEVFRSQTQNTQLDLAKFKKHYLSEELDPKSANKQITASTKAESRHQVFARGK